MAIYKGIDTGPYLCSSPISCPSCQCTLCKTVGKGKEVEAETPKTLNPNASASSWLRRHGIDLKQS